MTRIARKIEITTDPPAVWATIADLEHVAGWNPNVESATCTAGAAGLGTARTCRLSGGGHIDEVVSEWEEGTRLWFAIGNHGGIRSADMGFHLTETPHGTRVTAEADYHVAFGPLGPVIDRIAVKRQMARMLDDALAGLKDNMEATKDTHKEGTS
jgi:uncharacterized protein YndB with AHSA1/START domain